MARKTNHSAVEMDKTSFFFAQNCGACHPGGASLQFDREGFKYYDRASNQYRWDPATQTGLASSAGLQLDGDYGLVNAAGVAVTAPWATTGVAEADCLMCHGVGYSWRNRAATQGAGAALYEFGPTKGAECTGNPAACDATEFCQSIATSPARSICVLSNGSGAAKLLPAFELAPSAGAGLVDGIRFCTAGDACNPAPGTPPKANVLKLKYPAELDAGGFLAFPKGKVVKAPADGACIGCHGTPDRKKSGRSWQVDTDVHKAAGLGCVTCHPAGSSASSELIGHAGMHEIAKGDAAIGSVRDDLDGTVNGCVDCHLLGAMPPGMTLAAPDPTQAHLAIPPLHFEKMRCQVCHVRYLQDSALTETTPSTPAEVPELFIDMATNGRQQVKVSTDFLKTDPLDPTRDLPGLTGAAATRWYPGVRLYKGRLTTVKPLLTAWVGDWLDGIGDSARVKPIALRHVRAMLQTDASGAVQNANVRAVLSGAANTRAELRAYLQELANPAVAVSGGQPVFIGTPVIVRAGKVWYLNRATGDVSFFESSVAESHDFGVNHNVVPRRDPANPVLQPGPWGSGGCGECHSEGSPFFFTKHLADPAGDDGAPVYRAQWEAMGYSPQYVKTVTAGVPLVGPAGPAGPQGPSGADGAKGEEGDSGCATGGVAGPGALMVLAALAAARRRFGR